MGMWQNRFDLLCGCTEVGGSSCGGVFATPVQDPFQCQKEAIQVK